MRPVYEVVRAAYFSLSGDDLFRLHRDWLLPMMPRIGVRPVLLLMTEIGSCGKGLA